MKIVVGYRGKNVGKDLLEQAVKQGLEAAVAEAGPALVLPPLAGPPASLVPGALPSPPLLLCAANCRAFFSRSSFGNSSETTSPGVRPS